MKHYEKMNRFLGSDVIYTEKGTSFESYIKNEIILCLVEPIKSAIKYFSIKKGN